MSNEKRPDLKPVMKKKARERAPLSVGMGAEIWERDEEGLVVDLGKVLGIVPAPGAESEPHGPEDDPDD